MWRALREPGLERGDLLQSEGHWILRGAILRLSACRPAKVRYEIISDSQLRAEIADVSCHDDQGKTELQIKRDVDGWYGNDKRLNLPLDCTDVDLAWSPSTNTLPIRRLNLNVGADSGPLVAACGPPAGVDRGSS